MDRQTQGLGRDSFSAWNILCRQTAGVAEIHSHVKGKMNGCRQPPLTCLALSAIMQIWRASRFSPFTPFITLLFYTVFWTLHIIWRRTSDDGIILRMNRSIQVEGAFGVLKEDYAFRRFLTGGKHKTQTQFLLLSFAFNIQKLCNRLNSGRFHMPLFEKMIA